MPGPAPAKPDVVVFDIGNVLLRWDPRFLYRKIFADRERMEWFLATVVPPEWNLAQDGGRDWDTAIAEAAARHPELLGEIRVYRERWHEMIAGQIDGSIAILIALDDADVPLYAITNFAGDTFREVVQRNGVFSLFRDIVVSADVGLLKPDPRIYRLLAERNGLDPARCVFIDDVPKNVAGAEAAGMRGLLFVDPPTLAADLAALGLPGLPDPATLPPLDPRLIL